MHKFELTIDQVNKAHKWLRVCDITINAPQGAIGGLVTYEFTPTGMGIIAKVYYAKDMPQQQFLDLTDYDSW